MATGIQGQHACSAAMMRSSTIHKGLTIAGGLLVGYGILRGSAVGLISVIAGAGALFWGLSEGGQRAWLDLGDSTPPQPVEPEPAVERDVVDEASWESFPASDAPAY